MRALRDLAIVAVMSVGFGGCAFFGESPGLEQRVELPPGVFQQALEQFVSARTLSWQNSDGNVSGTITPIRSFQRKDGVYCREYTAHYVDAARGGLSWRGIACRGAEGVWRHVGDALPV